MKVSSWRPEELLFWTATLEGETLVTFCPKYWFEREGFCYEGVIDVSDILPDMIKKKPIMECTYESEYHSSKVHRELENLGFGRSDEFDQYMEDHLEVDN